MTACGIVGAVRVTPREAGVVSLEWEIPEFLSLAAEVGDHYHSRYFDAWGRMYFRIYPNGLRHFTSECCYFLHWRFDSGACEMLSVTAGIRGVEEMKKRSIQVQEFSPCNSRCRWFKICQRSELSGLLNRDALIITLEVMRDEPRVSRSDRALEVTRDLKTLLSDGNGSDFMLKLGDRGWPVHRAILECRSEYFANMFRHEWLENAAGEVMFGDLDEKAMDNVLQFIYSGDVEDLSPGNVCETYAAAHRFLLEGLKMLCVEHMKETMCKELVFKALVLAETYGEKEVRQSALLCLVKKSTTIFFSGEWKEFKETHPSIVATLFEETSKRVRGMLTNGRIVS